MSSLFNQAARQERERFFWRIDSQWGKGLKRVQTKPDRCPDFRVVTRPNIRHDWGVFSFDARGLAYSGNKKECRNWLLAMRTLWPLTRLELREIAQRSKQTAPLELPRTHEVKPSSQHQTLVLSRHDKPMSKVLRGTALGSFMDAPSPLGHEPTQIGSMWPSRQPMFDFYPASQ